MLFKIRQCNIFLGVHGFTPVPALNGEMGWLPSSFRRYLNTIQLWNRLIKMDNNRLTKSLFLWGYEQTQSSWCQNVKEIFSKLNFDYEYNLKQSLILKRQRLICLNLQNMNGSKMLNQNQS